VYVTLGIDAPVTALDGATGVTARTFAGSEHTREIVICDGSLLAIADTSRSRLPDYRRNATYVWENTRHANPNWGWQGDSRKILTYDVDSGRRLWEVESPVAPCSLAADSRHVVFHDGEKLVCRALDSGAALWESEPAPTTIPVHTNTGPRVLIYKNVVLFAGNNGKMSGWSLREGKKLWERRHKPSGHQSLKDLFVTDGLVWTGSIAGNKDDGVFTGYDPFTGEQKREFPPDVYVHWFHHRCYPCKATGRYLLAARNGTEYIDLKTERWKPNHWVRGGCIYGVMPCNGMTYAPMHSCGCQLEAKLTGFNALTAGPVPRPTTAELSGRARLEQGPAFGHVEDRPAATDDWPTYRHDAGRSGSAPTTVGPKLGHVWQTTLGGQLSAATIADGKALVASIDTHTLFALDAATGRQLWTYTTGGRIDSPPTYHQGLVLFGSADGYVYALHATDGALVWRFRAAPVDQRMMAWEQLESAWPVHGTVLVKDGLAFFTAGRSSFLDDGITLYAVNPEDGNVVWQKQVPDVGMADILVSDGQSVFFKMHGYDPATGKKTEPAGRRLTTGANSSAYPSTLLDDSYYSRAWWGNGVAAAEFLVFDDTHTYAYSLSTDPKRRRYGGSKHLFFYPGQEQSELAALRGEKKMWKRELSLRVKAMVLAKDLLFVWGLPQRTALEDYWAPLLGGEGSELRVFSADEGKELHRVKLDAVPVFDGMAVAYGRLYLAARDGRLLCFGE
jgi:outer membrane protein assembly factor BamB